MVSDRAYIFHMSIPRGKTVSLVRRPKPPVDVKVKYQGHIFFKLAIAGALAFHNYDLKVTFFFFFFFSI